MAEEEEVKITDKAGDWNRFLKKHYKAELGEIAREFPHKKSLIIDYRKLEKHGKKVLNSRMNSSGIPEKSSRMSGMR